MERTIKIVCFGLLAAMLVVALGGCQKKTAGDVIKIGVFEPLTGANAGGGALELEGVRLANELNPTVEVGGKTYKVELVVADNRSDRIEAANAVQRLVDQARNQEKRGAHHRRRRKHDYQREPAVPPLRLREDLIFRNAHRQ